MSETNSKNFPKFPPKKFFGSNSETFIIKRQKELNAYFKIIFENQQFYYLKSLQNWIKRKVDLYNNNNKQKEKKINKEEEIKKEEDLIKKYEEENLILNEKENDIGFLTGGGDGYVFIWDTKLNIINKISIRTKEISSMNYRIRSVCENNEGGILIGTRGGEIIEIENDKPKICLRGHFDGELWGLCADPKKDIYYTVGEDKLLGVWDIKTKKLILKCTLKEKSKTIDCSPNCKELAVGCESGMFYIYDTVSLKLKYEKNNKQSQKNAIQIVKYSPNGDILSVAGIDGNYITK